MTFDINGTQEDISAMLVSAERYALGRRSYIVQWTCEFIGNNLHLLTKGNKDVMIRDIENASDYGDECDEKCWKALLEKLKKEGEQIMCQFCENEEFNQITTTADYSGIEISIR